ncbi:RNA-binding domain-containing protein [Ruminococcus bromii]|uniref:RNA-binding domain-containing protein n=1 Tax=Ruminococcus bromii TaxID=40518 RepID=UPI00241D59F8|nr:RNA-binding domain-containing protein [Ruminococcus bromii]
MNIDDFAEILKIGESINTEFKSWNKVSDMKKRINLAVDELIAFANNKGGTLYFGVEDNGEVTGCDGNYDLQNIIESIYEKTRPSIFVDPEEIEYNGKKVIALTVASDGITHATTDGRCLKRLGKNSKPFYPDEMSNRYSEIQSSDFSGRILSDSTEDDINKLEVYKLKEKLKARNPESTLADMDDIAFLRDLALVKSDSGNIKLTVAGLLFVGKGQAINRLLPQAEVIYLHYSESNLEEYDARLDMKAPIISVIDRLSEKIQDSNRIVNVQVGLFRLEIVDFPEKVFQEALLNALSHRDYQSQGAVYVKHYPDKIVIENPGAFLDGITENNIITHPSVPRNKLIAETLQHLKYVQRTGQGVDIIFREMISSGKPFPEYKSYNDAVSLTIYSAIDDIDFVKFIANEENELSRSFSLSELMILRYLKDNRKITMSEAESLIQEARDQAQNACSNLKRYGLIELSGNEYMLTAKIYDELKNSVDYTKDKAIQYIKAREMILEYIRDRGFVNNELVRELCGFSQKQARIILQRMRKENLIELSEKGRYAKYIIKK